MHMHMHFQMHKGPFEICIGPLLNKYWGNSGFQVGGFDIRGRYNRGKEYVCANVDVYGNGYGSSREHQRPQRSEKEPQLC